MTFNETHPDDVSSIEFFKTKSSLLLSASVDGMLCLFDLKQENEEEAAETGKEITNENNKISDGFRATHQCCQIL
jgi:hypothetical protein